MYSSMLITLLSILNSAAASMPICGITGTLRNTTIHSNSQAVSNIEDCINLCQHQPSQNCKALGYVELDRPFGIAGECSIYQQSVEEIVRATSNSTVLFFDAECFDEVKERGMERSTFSPPPTLTKHAQTTVEGSSSIVPSFTPESAPEPIYSALPIGPGTPLLSPSPEPILPSDPFVTNGMEQESFDPVSAGVSGVASATSVGAVERVGVVVRV
ncbi:Apple-like protein [Ascosphaera apis ARSEF 7405]|uniref:Apple-like protein n=1 Tax=Ascosphaera apis ARSEF 7405 TaxID=392613 RepID=A0A167YNV3_9EURO|nr:Apple-like protein [Ascosphaera apis ARSEF 7405]